MMIVTASKAGAANLAFFLMMTASVLPAQNTRIQARLGNGDDNNGKCTVEVEVDDVAEIEVSRTEAQLRTLSGGAASFRRMDCTGPLPARPTDFRFEGVDGRGSQQLIRDPRQGNGVAVVRIDDRDRGREAYTFDLIWSNRGNNGGSNTGGVWPNNNGGFSGSAGNGNRNGNGRVDNGNWNGNRNNGNGGFNANGLNQAGANQAMRACQAEVANRIRRGGYSDIQFLRADFDNNRGRADSIGGVARAIQTFGTDQFDFACRVDLATGRLGDVRVDRSNGRR